jgi:hypothetical protein
LKRVKRQPKTCSGKILRGMVQKIADSQDFKQPATIDDPAILGEIAEALQARATLSLASKSRPDETPEIPKLRRAAGSGRGGSPRWR